jgi:hypothetical protein
MGGYNKPGVLLILFSFKQIHHLDAALNIRQQARNKIPSI